MYELYLRRHDRITTWDMVDRAAPSVIGRHLLGRPVTPLLALANAPEPLRRRSAMTAPLWFVRYGDDADLAKTFAVAEILVDERDPVVSKAVEIALKHAGGRAPNVVEAFLGSHLGRRRRSDHGGDFADDPLHLRPDGRARKRGQAAETGET